MMALNRPIYRDIKAVSETLIVHCDQIPVSEHLWAYLEFSFDKNFSNKDWLIIPTEGAYDLYFSVNGKHWRTWLQNVDVTKEDYEQLYMVGGWLEYVKAVPVQVPDMTSPIHRQVDTFDIVEGEGNLPYSNFPTEGSGVGDAIVQGDIFEITTGGYLGSRMVTAGSFIIANRDDAGQNNGHWTVIEPGEDFVPGQIYARLSVARV